MVIDTVVDQIRERRAASTAPQRKRDPGTGNRNRTIELSRSTLDGWVMRVGELLGLIAAALRPWDKNCSKAIISRQTGRRSRWIYRCMMQTTKPTSAIQSPSDTIAWRDLTRASSKVMVTGGLRSCRRNRNRPCSVLGACQAKVLRRAQNQSQRSELDRDRGTDG